MSSDFDDREPSIDLEAVERRGEPRGVVRDLFVDVPDAGRCQALEASRKGFFAELASPDDYVLGDIVEIGVRRGDRHITCKAEIIRKEIHPRRGIALRITHIAPVESETLKLILE